MKRLFLMVILVAPVAAVPRAQACSSDSCQPPVRLFYVDGDVPANLIHFKVNVDDPGPLELRRADGTMVPAGIRMVGPDRVFSPDADPAPGQMLTLHYRANCSSPYPDRPPPPPQDRTFKFNVSSARPIELQPVSLTVVERGVHFRGVPNDEALFLRYQYVSPDRTGSLRHLVDDNATIDGERFGGYENTVYTACRPPRAWPTKDSCNYVTGVTPGEHTLQMRTRIVGIDQDFAASLLVDTNCEQIASIPEPPSLAGDPRQPGNPGQPGDLRPAGQSAGGCVIGAGGQRSSLMPLAISIVALAWMQRRRRRGR